MPNLYASLTALKIHMQVANNATAAIADTADDVRLLRILEAVSRDVDDYCNRRFYAETRTRYYSPRCADHVLVDDLLSVTSLKTDADGDRTYETTWLATDYDLEPANAPFESAPAPYTRICLSPLSAQYFPRGPRAVEIAGVWGYSQRLVGGGTLAAAITTAGATSIILSSSTLVSPGETIRVDSEDMYVSSMSGATATVERGVNGSAAATHLNAADVSIHRYHPTVTEALLYQSALNNLAGAAATGQAGVADFQQPIRAGGLHPFTRQMLDPLRRLELV